MTNNLVPPLNIDVESLRRQDILPINETESEFYLRITIDEADNSVNDIIKILGDAAIDIKSMTQESVLIDLAPHKSLVLFTEISNEKSMQSTIKRLNSLSFVTKPVKMIRVER